MTHKGTETPRSIVSRRNFLAASGASVAFGLAGCIGGNDGGGNDGGDDGGSDGGNDGGDEPTPEPTEAPLSGEVNIAGSSTVYPVSTAVGEEFSKMHPDVQVSVASTGSGGGFKNFFCPGKTDINDASRPIKDSEKEQCGDNDVNPIEFQVATDALTVVINNDNDWATEMTIDQLAQIWGPDAAETWSDVESSWPDEKIERYGPTSASGTFDYFTETVIGEEDSHTKDYQGTEQDNTIVQGVQGSEYAIGYFGFAYYTQNQDTIQAVAIDNGNGPVEPSLDNAKSGKYKPLSRPLFIYIAEKSLEKPQVAAYCTYYMEQTPTDLISQIGYVPLTEEMAQENMDKLESSL